MGQGGPGGLDAVEQSGNWFGIFSCCTVLCVVAQSCPTLCHPIDYILLGSSVHGDSPDKNTGVGCHAFLQGIFPTQEMNPILLHCRQILYCLSNQTSPLFLLYLVKSHSLETQPQTAVLQGLGGATGKPTQMETRGQVVDWAVPLGESTPVLGTKELMLLNCGVGEDS